MLAFQKAIDAGAHGLEIDVQLSRDGVPVVFHDEQLTRVTGVSGLLSQYTLKELQALDVGSFFDSSWKGEKIPTLYEVFAWARDQDIFLNIELKNGIIPYPGLEKKVVEGIRDYQLFHQTIISSFNHPSLLHAKQIDSQIHIGLLFIARLYRPEEYACTLGASALHPYYLGVDRQMVEDAKEKNLSLHPFTVNEKSEMKKLVAMGVDAIITDYPDRLSQVLGE